MSSEETMRIDQREQNPDVNSYNPSIDPGEDPGATERPPEGPGVEQKPETDIIPVPPDAAPNAPIEEPPGTGGPPVGDVDDSPKRIA